MSTDSFRRAIAKLQMITKGRHDITVALLDGPVCSNLSCFSNSRLQLFPGYDSDENIGPAADHGTSVASVIWSSGPEVIGVAPYCSGLICPIIKDSNDGKIFGVDQLGLGRAIQLAATHGASVINISAGVLSNAGAVDSILLDAISAADAAGALIVAAAGNDGCDCIHLPAAMESVLAVGAHDANGQPLAFSNFGHSYQFNGILAPGLEIPVITAGGNATRRSGTSFATALVAGAIALILSAARETGLSICPREIREVIFRTSVPCPPTGATDCAQYLRGRIDLSAALLALGLSPKDVVTVKRGGMKMVMVENASGSEKTNLSASGGAVSADEVAHGIVASALEEAPVNQGDGMKERLVLTGAKIVPSDCDCGCGGKGGDACTCATASSPQLVYALGSLGIDFGTEARRDAFLQAMPSPDPDHTDIPPNPSDIVQLADFLGANEFYEQGLLWTLNLDATPIYAIRPSGTYAVEIAKRLIQIYRMMGRGEPIDVIAIPGYMHGSAKLMSGQIIPIIYPDLRGIATWTTAALVAMSKPARDPADDLKSFLDRIYFEFRNLGVAPQDRALNYAGTNASQVSQIFNEAYNQRMVLDGVKVIKSPICRPDSDCWDIVMTFFKPEDRFTQAKMSYRFAVDVSETLPILVGTVRRWSSY